MAASWRSNISGGETLPNDFGIKIERKKRIANIPNESQIVVSMMIKKTDPTVGADKLKPKDQNNHIDEEVQEDGTDA